MRAPVPGFTPELLAQIAQGAFRPPQGGGAPGLPGMQMPTGGMGLGDGMAGLAQGLAGWKPTDIFMGKERTAGDTDLGGYGASPVDPMSGNPNAQPVEIFNPSGAASGGGFNPFSWIKGLF